MKKAVFDKTEMGSASAGGTHPGCDSVTPGPRLAFSDLGPPIRMLCPLVGVLIAHRAAILSVCPFAFNAVVEM